MELSKPIILILISRSGGGHLNLAQSLKDILSTDYDVVIVDPQSPLVEQGYTFVSRKFVTFLDWQYTLVDQPFVAWGVQIISALIGYKRFARIIAQVRPQLIITTHAMVSYVATRVNEKSNKPVPLVFQLTDLAALHRTWFIEKYADAYLAPTQEIFTQALQRGIQQQRVHITGRPMRRQFLEAPTSSREEILTALGFDPKVFTIFVQSGAMGATGVERTIASIQAITIPIQVILAVGNNNEMAAHYATTPNVCVLSFTEIIAPYMAAADVIAGKAGASFISEAFTLGKPFIATTFIPGQETPNLHFIEQHNLGWVCLEAAEQQKLFALIASNPRILTEKLESIRAYQQWNAQANQRIKPLIDNFISTVQTQYPLNVKVD